MEDSKLQPLIRQTRILNERRYAEAAYYFVLEALDYTIFLAGPPDNIDEEDTFRRIIARDKTVDAELNAQDEALEGKQGGVLLAIDKNTGKQLSSITLSELPTWDGMAAANGKIYITTEKGNVICLE